MREILFRGKSKDNDVWVEGYYCGKANKTIFSPAEDSAQIVDKELYWHEVIPETVGQYTGLKDKNGKMIFEGDIVECTDTNCVYGFTAVVLFGNPNSKYNWGFQLKRIGGAEANTDILLWVDMEDTGAYIEVVGNVHDKSELVEGLLWRKN